MLPSAEKEREQIKKLEKQAGSIVSEIKLQETILQTLHDSLNTSRQRELVLLEIYRVACIQFPRLRVQMKGTGLTKEDVKELEKWIGRAKSIDGLKDIMNALRELEKYYPKDIKSNLYALVQKIIIGGAYGGGIKTRKRAGMKNV